MIYSLWNSK